MAPKKTSWRTPTGAMLWEIWGRQRWNFLWPGVALLTSWLFVYWKEHGAPDYLAPGLTNTSPIFFLGAYLHLLVCFGYIEVNATKVQTGYPSRLLLKPLSTLRLVLVPMLFGGAIITAVFAIWAELVLRHLWTIPLPALLWISTAALSFFWWIQALSWSLPPMKGRVIIDLAMAVIHLLVGIIPLANIGLLTFLKWPILVALLLSAVPVAVIGLTLMRQGRWDGPSKFASLWTRNRCRQTLHSRKKFRSAFGAQFWLEWRRQGLLLPGISGGFALLAFPFFLLALEKSGDSSAQPGGIVMVPILVPLLLSGILGAAMAKFDPLESVGELPIYIAVRPMSNGGFIMAKIVMALATSALTWLVTTFGICFTFAWVRPSAIFPTTPSVTPYGPMVIILGCLPLLLLLIILTWKNLLSGIGAGLTGRPWVVTLLTLWNSALFTVLLGLITATKIYEPLLKELLRWIPAVLIVCLAVKVVGATGAFIWSLRRNAIAPRTVAWIVGGWLLCGLFVAGYAALICHAMNKTDVWIWAALAGFQILPLAGLAVAPLALAWNRHR